MLRPMSTPQAAGSVGATCAGRCLEMYPARGKVFPGCGEEGGMYADTQGKEGCPRQLNRFQPAPGQPRPA
jgi:hypothetical protein